jgi:hypothetical protein
MQHHAAAPFARLREITQGKSIASKLAPTKACTYLQHITKTNTPAPSARRAGKNKFVARASIFAAVAYLND